MTTTWKLPDIVKFSHDGKAREIGYRIGIPVLRLFIGSFPSEKIKDSPYNKVYARNFKLQKIDSGKIVIEVDIRWEKYEKVPFTDRYWKRAEVNCDAQLVIVPFVSDTDHKIYIHEPQTLVGNCVDSGIGLEEMFDYLASAVTYVLSGGEEQIGLHDIFAGYGSFLYSLRSLFDNKDIVLADKVSFKLILKDLIPFIDRISELDGKYYDFYLHRVTCEPNGLWQIFKYPESLANDIYDLIQGILTVQNTRNLDLGLHSNELETVDMPEAEVPSYPPPSLSEIAKALETAGDHAAKKIGYKKKLTARVTYRRRLDNGTYDTYSIIQSSYGDSCEEAKDNFLKPDPDMMEIIKISPWPLFSARTLQFALAGQAISGRIGREDMAWNVEIVSISVIDCVDLT